MTPTCLIPPERLPVVRGRWNEALKNVEQARDRDPRNLVSAVGSLCNLSGSCMTTRRQRKQRATHFPFHRPRLSLSWPVAAVALFRNGDTAPLRSALRKVPRNFDPGGSTSTIALRLSLMERDLEEADRVLAACAHEKLDDNGLSGVAGALDGYTVPKRWYAGLIAHARGDESSARAVFRTGQTDRSRMIWPNPLTTLK